MDDGVLIPPPVGEPEIEAPVIALPSRVLEAVDAAVDADGGDDDGLLDFDIVAIQPRAQVEMGPGSKGRLVPYYSYGWGAVCTPQTQLLGKDGKKMAVIVPLPPGGMIKLSDLKKRANQIWREARQAARSDG